MPVFPNADISSSTEGGHPELQVRLDRNRLAAYGIGVADVASVLRAMVQGEIATDITRTDRTIDIRVRAAEQFRNSGRALENLTVTHAGSTAIPLSAVAEVIEIEGPAEIRRADGSRIARITANLDDRDLGSASAEIRAALEAMSWPSGYDWRLGGQQADTQVGLGKIHCTSMDRLATRDALGCQRAFHRGKTAGLDGGAGV